MPGTIPDILDSWVNSHARIKEYSSVGGGGGCPGRLTKKALTLIFFCSPQLILQKSNGQSQRNLSFFKVPEGVQHFMGGGGGEATFSRGVQLLIPYRNPYNL